MRRPRIEWPTWGLLAATYVLWLLATTALATLWLPLGIVATGLALVLHSSLTHEALHGHPTGNDWLNAALVFPGVGLFIPYLRFRDTHLAHHMDARLTDPYDDPESNFCDPKAWEGWCGMRRRVMEINNTLAGRMLIGPALGQVAFMLTDWRAIRAGDTRVLMGWALHIPALVPVIWWMVAVSALPVWAYLLAAYGALSILKVRTFLEHQAHERARARTVVIEDRGLWSLLFLNNNLHAVHHMHPRLPWYRLPGLYFANKARYLARNDSYVYGSYREIFRQFFLRAKDPVPHPLWSRDK